jgi:hypothetical protein
LFHEGTKVPKFIAAAKAKVRKEGRMEGSKISHEKVAKPNNKTLEELEGGLLQLNKEERSKNPVHFRD